MSSIIYPSQKFDETKLIHTANSFNGSAYVNTNYKYKPLVLSLCDENEFQDAEILWNYKAGNTSKLSAVGIRVSALESEDEIVKKCKEITIGHIEMLKSKKFLHEKYTVDSILGNTLAKEGVPRYEEGARGVVLICRADADPDSLDKNIEKRRVVRPAAKNIEFAMPTVILVDEATKQELKLTKEDSANFIRARIPREGERIEIKAQIQVSLETYLKISAGTDIGFDADGHIKALSNQHYSVSLKVRQMKVLCSLSEYYKEIEIEMSSLSIDTE